MLLEQTALMNFGEFIKKQPPILAYSNDQIFFQIHPSTPFSRLRTSLYQSIINFSLRII